VGVPKSVNTVSKHTVSVEKVSTSDEEVDTASEIQATGIKPTAANNVRNKRKRNFIK
jgi:hypothetical protein